MTMLSDEVVRLPVSQDHGASLPSPRSSTTAASVPQNDLGDPHPIKGPTIEEADLEPWRYRGYPAFCKWLAADEDFFVLRTFESTSARVALYLQDLIVQAEDTLKEEDEKARKEGQDSGTFRRDKRKRNFLIHEQLLPLLERYQRFMLDHMELKSRPRATPFQRGNVLQWLENANHNAIAAGEVGFIQREDDLIPLVSTHKTPVRNFINRYNFLGLAGIGNRKINERLYTDQDFEKTTTVYHTGGVVDQGLTYITLGFGLAMLIGPLWLLPYIVATHPGILLSVIFGLLILFTVFAALFTVAKPFNILATTAVYASILMLLVCFETHAIGGTGG